MPNLSTILAGTGEFVHFAGRSLAAALGSFLRPTLLPRQVHAVLVGALPLGLAAGIALGAVVWMHTHAMLARTGTAEYLPTILAVSVLLELAPIGAGLIVAARTGSQLGAELGAMRITEQIDALEMLGISTMRELIGPRVLACMIGVPLLHVFIATLALLSGFAAESLVGHSNWLAYQSACLKELDAREVLAAGLKTIVFGFLIGTSGCYRGLKVEGGTEGVGQAATSAVVLSCLLVLAADVGLVGVIRIVV
ncbi:MAG: ABC transporter permease [Planctomycetes bacterium]|nr:ABC transporter permease [Planctomycetota bacterium]